MFGIFIVYLVINDAYSLFGKLHHPHLLLCELLVLLFDEIFIDIVGVGELVRLFLCLSLALPGLLEKLLHLLVIVVDLAVY